MIWIKKPNTNKPVCLDLFCGAGGAAMGYFRAGYYIIGVDNQAQPNYPFEFCQADFREIDIPEWVSIIHASPPCQAHSRLRYPATRKNTGDYPDYIPETRDVLVGSNIDYIIENVPDAPLNHPFMLCGTMFGLGVRRHRLFESNIFILSPPHDKCPAWGKCTEATYHKEGDYLTVIGKHGHIEKAKKALGINWMKRDVELSQSIPPAYTEWIGKQILGAI